MTVGKYLVGAPRGQVGVCPFWASLLNSVLWFKCLNLLVGHTYVQMGRWDILWLLTHETFDNKKMTSKDENEKNLVRISYLGRNIEWDSKRRGVYPVRICGILFYSGWPHISFIFVEFGNNLLYTPYVLSCFSTSIGTLFEFKHRKHEALIIYF